MTWLNLFDILESEKNWPQKNTSCMALSEIQEEAKLIRMMEIRKVVACGVCDWLERGMKELFWSNGNILYLDWGVG